MILLYYKKLVLSLSLSLMMVVSKQAHSTKEAGVTYLKWYEEYVVVVLASS